MEVNLVKIDETREACRFIRKSGNRFSENIMLPKINESGGA